MTSYGGIQMFMEKLNQLINYNYIPLLNNPGMLSERPQFQLLYDELNNLIQTLFIDKHQELAELNDLKKRFIDAADEAEYIVDLFLSSCFYSAKSDHPSIPKVYNQSVHLDDVMQSFESLKMEIMKLDLSLRPARTATGSAAGISHTRKSLRSKKLSDETIVGRDDDAGLIRDKLVEDQKKLDVVSIVGMGGIGKTTLATKVFNDRFIMHHFHARVWVTVSQRYDKRDVMVQILESIGKELNLVKTTDSGLREMVHKQLLGKRYLIVIDDIWHIQTWDEVKLFFPHNATGSRILLTSRLVEVAKHANSGGFIHHIGYLNKERSWELLRKKAFHDNECPEWSIEPGMQIIQNCKGLPLSVVIIAGILAKESWNKKLWVETAKRTGSYIVGDQNECLETLALSYNHLPLHMRECFLYLGGFPEDHKFQVKRLILLWVAEGFIQQDGHRSLEDTAETYLMDLIDRNLVIVSSSKNFNGAVIACTLHDLVRELCLSKANEEGFILETERLILSSNAIRPPYKSARMCVNKDINNSGPFALNLRSIISFSSDFRVSFLTDTFELLRVLDLQRCNLNDLPMGIELLVHLRYLAIWIDWGGFPMSICSLWGLQTLIYITSISVIELPRNISDLVNLRHLWSYSAGNQSFKIPFYYHPIGKPMNLQTIGNVKLYHGAGNFQNCFPYIKELTCSTSSCRQLKCDFKSLTCLEKLKFTDYHYDERTIRLCITFPATLRSLTLRECCLSWSEMTAMQSLPRLQVLKLKSSAFVGSCWKTDGQEFRQLKFLRLEELDIKQWEACTASFPCLSQLEIYSCVDLEETPLEIGDIPTLELIKTKWCSESLNESVRRIEEDQNDLGNYDLNIDIR